MPTAELQAELEKEFDKTIRKQLKAAGFELLHATQRNHPFHSRTLRERIDKLASFFGCDPSLLEEAGVAKYTRLVRECDRSAGIAYCKEGIARHVANVVRQNRAAWAKGFGKYREFLRDRAWWKGTYVDRALNPTDRPPIPDGPPPKPVYVQKGAALVLLLHDGAVDFYVRV
jgi:hypothetical protein